ncbi:uncharacterized protein LOC132721350 [Ruditapes philippinarum]|uniref:uncharacterized protein LOC132721350 n=1 Tax=Ruditapes philippinarum TaxID=129788 RepID=UPI00295B7E39|nr:uncharacterized protein LOC132721350 [Ruditapes philippinarum]
MKLFLVCLLVPVVLAAPLEDSKRFIIGGFTIDSLFDLNTLKCDVQIMLDVLGSDPTEQACEKECHVLIKDGLLDHSCPLICHAFQNLAGYFHETPKPGDQHAHCGGQALTTASG